MPELTASFSRDGDLLTPRPFTGGGWAPDMLGGRYLAGLVAWGADRHADPSLQPARLTVDMFRPATMAAVRVETRVVRDGRRIRVVDSSVLAGAVEICRGTTVYLRRGAPPRGETWFPPVWSAPAPDDVEPMLGPHAPPSGAWEARHVTEWGAITEHRQVWVRETRPFVDGEALTPFLRAALAADIGNGQLNAGPGGMGYINADLTLTLARLPEDEWIGLDARSRATAAGVTVGTLDVYDSKGRIGNISMVAVADGRAMAPD